MSETPLITQQVAIYRAFFKGYLEGDKRHINVANRTDPMKPSADDFKGCMKQFPRKTGAMEAHIFTIEFVQDDRIRLVDADTYQTADVKDFMHRNEDLDKAVDQAISAGLLRLSEIVFDNRHQLAAFNFSFRCGMLCGHGETVIFELHQGKWIRSKRSCGGWQS